MTLPDRLGCSTISFQHLALPDALHDVRALGFEEIDLGALPGVCDHVPFELDDRAIDDVAAAIADVDTGRGVIVLTDLFGGTPSNLAISLMECGRVEVIARGQRQRVAVSIIDNGAGIPPDVQARMFDPFFTTKPVGKGTGLGLDIVRRLLTHNDAEIEVESVPGRTEFRVTVPIAETGVTESRS